MLCICDHLASLVNYSGANLSRLSNQAAAAAWLDEYNALAGDPEIQGEPLTVEDMGDLDWYDQDGYRLVAYVRTESGNLVLYLDDDGPTHRIMCRPLQSTDRCPPELLLAII